MGGRRINLLRSPPFPGIDPAVTDLDAGPGEWRAVTTSAVRQASALLLKARVGGAFWGTQLAGRPRLIVPDGVVTLPTGDLHDAVVLATGATAGIARDRGGLVAAPANVDPWPLIEAATRVVAGPDTDFALLALAAGKQVHDSLGRPVKGGDELLAHALFSRRYRDPVSGAEVEVSAIIARLAGWRAVVDANRGLSAAAGMAFWKRREVSRLLWDGRTAALPFLKPGAAISRARREGGAVAAWPARVPPGFADRAAASGVPVRWIEDGFIRSAGLGSDLLPPLSLIVDDLWPYFAPDRPSRLEYLLEHAEFDDALLARAAALRRTIVERRIGKYGSGATTDTVYPQHGSSLVLVVGQVEDDMSVLQGGGGLTNLALIERARAADPRAFIIYRPHPDVEAGHRRGAIPDAVALALVDRIDRGGPLDALLTRVDTLHTLTSLTGFEALLRGVRVVVHGAPFYAGWGLTEDVGPPLHRRRRRLKLDQLVAGALILYPRYLDPRTGLPCTPEVFIEALGGVGVHGGWLVRLRRWQGRLKRLLG